VLQVGVLVGIVRGRAGGEKRGDHSEGETEEKRLHGTILCRTRPEKRCLFPGQGNATGFLLRFQISFSTEEARKTKGHHMRWHAAAIPSGSCVKGEVSGGVARKGGLNPRLSAGTRFGVHKKGGGGFAIVPPMPINGGNPFGDRKRDWDGFCDSARHELRAEILFRGSLEGGGGFANAPDMS